MSHASVDATNPAQLVRETVQARLHIWGQGIQDITMALEYKPPPRHALDYENSVGEWRDKHILGTQLGPNENGRHRHSRHEAERARPEVERAGN